MSREEFERMKIRIWEWAGRILIGILTFFAYSIYNDVKTLTENMPVMQEKIQTLNEKVERLENKVFFSIKDKNLNP